MTLDTIVSAMIGSVCLVIVLIGLAVTLMILRNKIDLSTVLSEGGMGTKASLSRLQMLVFTFAVVGVWLATSFESGALVEIPPTVLGALGISGGSYLVSKSLKK